MGRRIRETQPYHEKNTPDSRDSSHCAAVPPLPSIQETHPRLFHLPIPDPPAAPIRKPAPAHGPELRELSSSAYGSAGTVFLLAGLWCRSERRGGAVNTILSSLDITPGLGFHRHRVAWAQRVHRDIGLAVLLLLLTVDFRSGCEETGL